MTKWPWNALGLEGPVSLPEIRQAYAGCLKTTHPEEHPEQFQHLHAAYQAACRLARNRDGDTSNLLSHLPYQMPGKDSRDDEHPLQQNHESPHKIEQNQEDPAWKYDQLFQTPSIPQVEAKQLAVDQDDREHEQMHMTAEAEMPENQQHKAPDQAWDWDYDRLLQWETASQAKASQQKAEQGWNWDYDRLLQLENSTPETEASQEKAEQAWAWDWDYEQLFEQAQTEKNELRLHLRDTLRLRNRWRYKFWSKRDRLSPSTEQECWEQVSMALDILEQIFHVNAALHVWKQFFSSELFLQVKKEPDFVFGLEWLLESHTELPLEVCAIIYRAYGFMNRKQKSRVFVFGSYRPLLKLLQKHALLHKHEDAKIKRRTMVSRIGRTWLIFYILLKVIKALRIFTQM